jgi:glyoxylase-like metal-dependent hydrolase (beta-lactamase superfamily II)
VRASDGPARQLGRPFHAKVFLQEKKFNFWMKNPIAGRSPFHQITDPVANQHLAGLEGTERLQLVRGDKKILPGIQRLLCPGHTVGLQSVVVNTGKGTAIIGSDALYPPLG